jgi:hypothetical protein
MSQTAFAGLADQAARKARPRPFCSSRRCRSDGSVSASRRAISGVASTLASPGDHDPPAKREPVAEEAVQPADAALEAGRLVVDGNDDLELRRGGRERAPHRGQGEGELWHVLSIGPGPESPLGSR